MTYQVLARKWRPRDFQSLIGQDHVVRALTHALQHQRLHHAYLFTGTRGVGKTTIARILAKALNCIGPDGQGGVTATPCNVCRVCTAIDAGRFIDYIEMDAASNRGVDEMTQLLERAIYAPVDARVEVEPAALEAVARAARGSMRDALSLLDQAIAYSGGHVDAQAIDQMLGAIDSTLLVQLLDTLAERDGARLLALADAMSERSLSFGQALRDLASLLHRIALAQQAAEEGRGEPLDADVARLARRFTADEVQLYYQIALHGRNDLSLAPDEYAGFTMTLLRMLAFQPDVASSSRSAALSAPRPPRTAAFAKAPAARAAPGEAPAADLA